MLSSASFIGILRDNGTATRHHSSRLHCTENRFERVTKLLLTLLLTVQEKLAFDPRILAEKSSVHDDGTMILGVR